MTKILKQNLERYQILLWLKYILILDLWIGKIIQMREDKGG